MTVFLHIYEDDIKYFAIDKLNENLKTDVEAMDIDLTVFHSFPYATLQFNRVFIAENFPENNSHDTLLYAGNIFMHFNVMDIWNENYRVERVNVEGGVLNLKTNKEGSHNYDIFKERPNSLKSDKDFQFSLALMSLSDFDFSLHKELVQSAAKRHSLQKEFQLFLERLDNWNKNTGKQELTSALLANFSSTNVISLKVSRGADWVCRVRLAG